MFAWRVRTEPVNGWRNTHWVPLEVTRESQHSEKPTRGRGYQERRCQPGRGRDDVGEGHNRRWPGWPRRWRRRGRERAKPGHRRGRVACRHEPGKMALGELGGRDRIGVWTGRLQPELKEPRRSATPAKTRMPAGEVPAAGAR